MSDTPYNSVSTPEVSMSGANRFLNASWVWWELARGGKESERPKASELSTPTLELLQHFDAPGLPSEIHNEVIEELGRRYSAPLPEQP